MPRGIPKKRTRDINISSVIEPSGYEPSTQQAPYSPPQPVDLPPKSPYPQLEPGKIEYVPEFPKVVLREIREVWSDGSVVNTVHSIRR